MNDALRQRAITMRAPIIKSEYPVIATTENGDIAALSLENASTT